MRIFSETRWQHLLKIVVLCIWPVFGLHTFGFASLGGVRCKVNVSVSEAFGWVNVKIWKKLLWCRSLKSNTFAPLAVQRAAHVVFSRCQAKEQTNSACPCTLRGVFSWAWNKYRPDLFLGNKRHYCGWMSWILTQGYSSDRPGHPVDPLCPNMGNGLWNSLRLGPSLIV